MHSHSIPRWAATLAVLGSGLLLSACGGGGSDNQGGGPMQPATLVSLSGTAATGMALANASVQVKCVGATTTTTTTGADGSYAVSMAGGASLPCVLRAAAADGAKWHSVAQGAMTQGADNKLVVNITPLTELLLSRAAHREASSFFDAFAADTAKTITSEVLKTAQGELMSFLNGTVDASAVKDFISTVLKAATPGNTSDNAYDKLLDVLNERITPEKFNEWIKVVATNGPLPDPAPFVPELTLRTGLLALAVGQSATLVADLNYPPNVRYIRPPLSWSVVETDGGSVTSEGLYTAPAKLGTYHVKASRDDFANVSAIVTITVVPPGPIAQDPVFVPQLGVAPADLGVALMPGQTHHFNASINYPPGINYVCQPTSWKVVEADGGTITIDGRYTAPAKTGTYHVTVTRDDFKDKSVTLAVQVGAYQNLPLTRLPLIENGVEILGGGPAEQVLIRDVAAWLAWQKEHGYLSVGDLPVNGVDFERFMLVYVDLGARSPCFSTSQVLDVASVGGRLQVSIQDTPFGSGMSCIQAMLPGPNWLLMVPKSDLPLSVVVKP